MPKQSLQSFSSRIGRLEDRHGVPTVEPTPDQSRLERLKNLTPAEARMMSDEELLGHLIWILKEAGAPDEVFEGLEKYGAYWALTPLRERAVAWERSVGISLLSGFEPTTP